jgi:hypothetical protein
MVGDLAFWKRHQERAARDSWLVRTQRDWRVVLSEAEYLEILAGASHILAGGYLLEEGVVEELQKVVQVSQQIRPKHWHYSLCYPPRLSFVSANMDS